MVNIMNKLQAKARLLADKVVQASKVVWDSTFHKLWTDTNGVYNIKTKEAGQAQVRIMGNQGDEDEELLNQLSKKYKTGNLQSGVPNIEMEIGGENVLLTWDEAYNLGYALMRSAEIAYYG